MIKVSECVFSCKPWTNSGRYRNLSSLVCSLDSLKLTLHLTLRAIGQPRICLLHYARFIWSSAGICSPARSGNWLSSLQVTVTYRHWRHRSQVHINMTCSYRAQCSGHTCGTTRLKPSSKYFILWLTCVLMCKPGSSVSIVSGYGLDDRAISIRSPAEAKGLYVQTCSGAHPASCTMGTGGSFPWG
jgi:hypothetical protein